MDLNVWCKKTLRSLEFAEISCIQRLRLLTATTLMYELGRSHRRSTKSSIFFSFAIEDRMHIAIEDRMHIGIEDSKRQILFYSTTL